MFSQWWTHCQLSPLPSNTSEKTLFDLFLIFLKNFMSAFNITSPSLILGGNCCSVSFFCNPILLFFTPQIVSEAVYGPNWLVWLTQTLISNISVSIEMLSMTNRASIQQLNLRCFFKSLSCAHVWRVKFQFMAVCWPRPSPTKVSWEGKRLWSAWLYHHFFFLSSPVKKNCSRGWLPNNALRCRRSCEERERQRFYGVGGGVK